MLYKLLYIAKVELMSNKHTFSKWLSFAIAKDKVIISAPEHDLECVQQLGLCALKTVLFTALFLLSLYPEAEDYGLFCLSGDIEGLIKWWRSLILSRRQICYESPALWQHTDACSLVYGLNAVWQQGLQKCSICAWHTGFDVMIDNTLFVRFFWASQYFHLQKHKDGRH